MGPPRGRKGIHSAKKKFNRKYNLATKHRKRDMDQIHDDLAKRGKFAGAEVTHDSNDEKEKQVYDEDLPGGGLYYCVETARHFMSQDALDKHRKSKAFKQQCKKLRSDGAYTQDSAEAALGIRKEQLPSVQDDL